MTWTHRKNSPTRAAAQATLFLSADKHSRFIFCQMRRSGVYCAILIAYGEKIVQTDLSKGIKIEWNFNCNRLQHFNCDAEWPIMAEKICNKVWTYRVVIKVYN